MNSNLQPCSYSTSARCLARIVRTGFATTATIGLYQIHGILDFPVIAALGTITIEQSGQLIVGDFSATEHEVNLALDGLTPVIELDGRHYTFDTGADATLLYPAYFAAHECDVRKHYTPVEINVGGAGGSKKINGYRINFTVDIADQRQLRLDSVELITDYVNTKSQHYYDNIGNDVIGKFTSYQLDFTTMKVGFNK